MSMRRPQSDPRKVRAIIEKGGSTAAAHDNPDTVKNVQLRLPLGMITRIDTVRGLRTVKPPRHLWLLEAVLEKLEREERGGASNTTVTL